MTCIVRMGIYIPLTTMVMSLCASQARADDSRFAGIASIGAEYDSNVAVDDTDVNSNLGDVAATVAAGLDFQAIDTATVKLKLSYTYDATFHRRLKDFDLGIHQLNARLSAKAVGAMIGVDYRYAHIRLDHEGFLDLHILAPSVSGFVSESLYGRAGYSFVRKSYKNSVDLDADTSQISLDVYRFFAKRQGYFAAGFRHDGENAVGSAFDYKANQASARALVPIAVLGQSVKLRLSAAYGERTYSNVTPFIGERRREKRATYGVELAVPVTQRLTFRPKFRYVDRISNVPVFDYKEYSTSAALEYRF